MSRLLIIFWKLFLKAALKVALVQIFFGQLFLFYKTYFLKIFLDNKHQNFEHKVRRS